LAVYSTRQLSAGPLGELSFNQCDARQRPQRLPLCGGLIRRGSAHGAPERVASSGQFLSDVKAGRPGKNETAVQA
jgi:hypothetical protein